MLLAMRSGLLSLLFVIFVESCLQAQQVMLPPAERTVTQPPGIDLFVSSINQDKQGHLWMGTTNGLVRYDGQQLRLFYPEGNLQDVSIGQVSPDSHGRVWLQCNYGDAQSRLAYFDPQTQRIVFPPDTTRLVRDFLAVDGIRSLFVDHRDHLWIGRSQTGLVHVDPNTGVIESYPLDSIRIRSIDESADGLLWLGTNTGLYSVNPATHQVRRYLGDTQPFQINEKNPIAALHVRANGDILLGLYNQLAIFNPASGKLRQIHLPLPTPSIRMWTDKIVSDNQGNAYFSVGLMVCRLTPNNELQRLEFAYPAEKVISVYVSQGRRLGDDRLWVNAGRQLCAYDLSRLRSIPPLNILDVAINGTRLIENEQQREERFQRDTTGQASLFLKEGDYVTLHFIPYAEIKTSHFRYKLAGYDQQWQDFYDVYGRATYQPPAGTYWFVLNRAKRNGGWEPQMARVQVRVEPPFWKKAWFLSLSFLTLSALGFWLVQNQNRRRKLRQELARREFEAAALRELDELKNRFFANITHELRTPLTIILNGMEQLSHAPLDEPNQKQLQSVQRNAQQLMRLINETLDIAKLDAGKLDRRECVGDPIAFVMQEVEQFADLAAQRRIDLSWTENVPALLPVSNEPGRSLYRFDDDKLEKITYNLLSNALKFTPANGQVRVEARISPDHHLLLRVSDTGIGIPADQLPRIFERFHQVDNSLTRTYSGTGIGLALVKELTTWLGGTVRVESIMGRGSIFTVELPLTPHTTAEQAESVNLLAGPMQDANRTGTAPSIVEPHSRQNDQPVLVQPKETNQPLLLVVEDNEELRSYISAHLATSYRIVTAENGRVGLEQAITEVPDLIVSDVMMPEVDGYELVERLKADERTSHIPVVLLTAKASYDSRMKGLGAGADDYIGKPFSLDELNLRINNCLRTRQNWQRRLTATQPSHDSGLPPDPRLDKEERFLARLRGLILDHLTDETVDVDWLIMQAGMSRTQLHRKLVALTDHSTTRFIHSVRLTKAVELLQIGELNVAQVAQAVGYSSQSYFTKMFQEQFGYSPMAIKS